MGRSSYQAIPPRCLLSGRGHEETRRLRGPPLAAHADRHFSLHRVARKSKRHGAHLRGVSGHRWTATRLHTAVCQREAVHRWDSCPTWPKGTRFRSVSVGRGVDAWQRSAVRVLDETCWYSVPQSYRCTTGVTESSLKPRRWSACTVLWRPGHQPLAASGSIWLVYPRLLSMDANPPVVLLTWDIETTGGGRAPEMVEVALHVSKLSAPPMQSAEQTSPMGATVWRAHFPISFSTFVRPAGTIPTKHDKHDTTGLVTKAPVFPEAWARVTAFLDDVAASRGADARLILIAHSAAFDCRVLVWELRRAAAAAAAAATAPPSAAMIGSPRQRRRAKAAAEVTAATSIKLPVTVPHHLMFVDSLPAVRQAYPKLRNYGMADLVKHLRIDGHEPHRAASDAAVLAAILHKTVSQDGGRLITRWKEGHVGADACVLRKTLANLATPTEFFAPRFPFRSSRVAASGAEVKQTLKIQSMRALAVPTSHGVCGTLDSGVEVASLPADGHASVISAVGETKKVARKRKDTAVALASRDRADTQTSLTARAGAETPAVQSQAASPRRVARKRKTGGRVVASAAVGAGPAMADAVPRTASQAAPAAVASKAAAVGGGRWAATARRAGGRGQAAATIVAAAAAGAVAAAAVMRGG